MTLTGKNFKCSSGIERIRINCRDFPSGAVVENQPANAGDMGLSPGLVRSTCCGATKPMSHNY